MSSCWSRHSLCPPDSSVEDDILPAALGLGSGSQAGIFCEWEVAFLEVGQQYPDLQECVCKDSRSVAHGSGSIVAQVGQWNARAMETPLHQHVAHCLTVGLCGGT